MLHLTNLCEISNAFYNGYNFCSKNKELESPVIIEKNTRLIYVIWNIQEWNPGGDVTRDRIYLEYG